MSILLVKIEKIDDNQPLFVLVEGVKQFGHAVAVTHAFHIGGNALVVVNAGHLADGMDR